MTDGSDTGYEKLVAGGITAVLLTGFLLVGPTGLAAVSDGSSAPTAGSNTGYGYGHDTPTPTATPTESEDTDTPTPTATPTDTPTPRPECPNSTSPE